MNEVTVYQSTVDPVKVLTLELDNGNQAKIYLEAIEYRLEQYISSPMAKEYATQKEADRANAEYSSRIIRNVVRKVEGVAFQVGKGEVKPIEYEQVLLDDGTIGDGEMTLESYTHLMRLLNSKPSIAQEIYVYFAQSIGLDGVEVKKKAQSKKKA